MINIRTIHGLNVIRVLATTSMYQPVRTSILSKKLGLSMSYTESLIKQLKEGQLLKVQRGPGGGYQLQAAVAKLCVWDVVSCFTSKDVDTKYIDISSEFLAVFDLNQKIFDIKRKFLKAYPLSEVIKHMPSFSIDAEVRNASTKSFYFKPMRKQLLPLVPNSVFELSNFV